MKGEGAYSVFKHEGGPHRVQRVPVTESQGRIHTSSATVTVLPEAEEVEVQIDPNDLQIDVYRSSGPGGQCVNTTDSAVRITHKPTGIVVADAGREEPAPEPGQGDAGAARPPARSSSRPTAGREPSERKRQVGGGGRSEKIRTYNFKENRVTDHRIKLTSQLDGAGRRARRVHRCPGGRGEAAAHGGRGTGGMPARPTVREALGGRAMLGAAGVESPAVDAEALLAGRPAGPGVSPPRRGDPPRAAARRFGEMLRRRCAASRSHTSWPTGVPAHRSRRRPRVLIPRPETETLVELALELRPAGCSMLAPAPARSRWPSRTSFPPRTSSQPIDFLRRPGGRAGERRSPRSGRSGTFVEGTLPPEEHISI